MSEDKLGTYITKLMTTVLDKQQEQIVKDLALREIERLKVDISDFINKILDSKDKDNLDLKTKQEKQLLQEKKDGK
tara:strand:+ start:452 stop:679 length:228 start_codon:yes stop_codon:yes gene_type:complete